MIEQIIPPTIDVTLKAYLTWRRCIEIWNSNDLDAKTPATKEPVKAADDIRPELSGEDSKAVIQIFIELQALLESEDGWRVKLLDKNGSRIGAMAMV